MLSLVAAHIDTEPLSQRLLETFGSVERIINADSTKLQKVSGVSPRIAEYLQRLGEFQLYLNGVEKKKQRVVSTEDANELLKGIMNLYPVEHFVALFLDVQGNVISHDTVRGNFVKVHVSIRELVERAISVNAYKVVLSHNHPTGALYPSDTDIQITRTAIRALTSVEIIVMDHIIFTDKGYFSFKQTGYLDALTTEYQDIAKSEDYKDYIDNIQSIASINSFLSFPRN